MVMIVSLKHHIKRMMELGTSEMDKETELFRKDYSNAEARIKNGKNEMEKASKNRRLIQNR